MSMLAHASMASHFWDEGVFTSYIINKLPIASLDFKTPLEVLFNIKPDHHFLKVFGCLCYPCLLAYTSNKLKPRSLLCTFMGYSPRHKGYICLSTAGRLYISRSEVFEETVFPFNA